jgi:hypothetical protein
MSGRRNKGELPDCQWQQRLWIKENKWKLCLLNPPVFQKNNVFFFKKKKKKRRRWSRNLQSFSWEDQMGKQINSMLSTREQVSAAKLHRGETSLFSLPLFLSKNTRYEFHGNRWWNESVTSTC